MKKWKKSRNYRRMRDENGDLISDIITIDGVNVEVSEEVFLAYSRADRRERYISEDTSDRLFSLEQLNENRGQSDYMEMNTFPSAEEIFLEQEEDQSWEERKKRLPTVLEELDSDELELIQALYFKGLSAREYAKQLGVYHRTILYRKEKVLEKLREKFM